MVTLYRGAAYHLYRYKIWNVDSAWLSRREGAWGSSGEIRTTSSFLASISIFG